MLQKNTEKNQNVVTNFAFYDLVVFPNFMVLRKKRCFVVTSKKMGTEIKDEYLYCIRMGALLRASYGPGKNGLQTVNKCYGSHDLG